MTSSNRHRGGAVLAGFTFRHWLATCWSVVVAIATSTNIVLGQCEIVGTARITSSIAAPGDQFGWGISMFESMAVVGSTQRDTDAGYAKVLQRDALSPGGWSEVATLVADDGELHDRFGDWIAGDGDTIAVGAHADDGSTGSVYIFERDHGGPDNWGQVAKLAAADAATGDYFGDRLVLRGGLLAIAARWDDGKTGAVYIFKKGAGWADGSANQVAKLTAADATAGAEFGASIAIASDTLYVGAWLDDNQNGDDAGAMYVFREGAGWVDGDSNQIAKLITVDGAAGDRFGQSVATTADALVVGAYGDDGYAGSAYVFEEELGWADGAGNQRAKLTASDRQNVDYFSYRTIGLGTGYVVIASSSADDNGDESGAAYVFLKPAGGWGDMTESARLVVAQPNPDARLGVDIAVSDTTATIGAPGEDGFSGAVYVFDGLLDCNGDAILDACDIAGGTSSDCNGNAIPDECDISGASLMLRSGGPDGQCLDVDRNTMVVSASSPDPQPALIWGGNIAPECDCGGSLQDPQLTGITTHDSTDTWADFSREFTLPSRTENTLLLLKVRADDGAEIYLNDELIDTIDFRPTPSDPPVTHELQVDNPGLFREGRNTLQFRVVNTGDGQYGPPASRGGDGDCMFLQYEALITYSGSDCDTDGMLDECEFNFDGDGLIDDCDPDIDNDGVPNESDVCDYTPITLPPELIELNGGVLGDLDGDCDVDLVDYAIMQQRFTGPN